MKLRTLYRHASDCEDCIEILRGARDRFRKIDPKDSLVVHRKRLKRNKLSRRKPAQPNARARSRTNNNNGWERWVPKDKNKCKRTTRRNRASSASSATTTNYSPSATSHSEPSSENSSKCLPTRRY